MMTAQCLMVNCRNKAPDGEAMCSEHRSDHKGVGAVWYAGFEAGAKAMQEVLDALSKAGPIHAGPVGGDLGRKYPDARQCVVEFAPGQGGGAYDLHTALVSLRAALDPAQIAGGKP